MKVVLAGGSGALGRRLADDLADRGHDTVVLTRSPQSTSRHRQVGWDGRTVGTWAKELAGAAVVNLAGELVDRRPSRAGIELLTSSRVDPTRALVAAADSLPEPVPVWIQASTLALHGDSGDAVLDEMSAPADGPPQMAGVARAWEASTAGARTDRLVVLRTGIVFDRDTPALDRLSSLTWWGLGGRVASGEQWVSWLHIADWLAVVRWALTSEISGVVVASSPNPARNSEMMAALRAALRRRAAPPTPAFAVRLGALALRTDPALALTGRRAFPSRLLAAGFEFVHPDIGEALNDLLR